MNETGQSHFHVKQKIISKKYLVLFYALFKVLRKCILQPSNNAKMKNSIWRNVVDPLYNFSVNMEKNCKNGNVCQKQSLKCSAKSTLLWPPINLGKFYKMLPKSFKNNYEVVHLKGTLALVSLLYSKVYQSFKQ